MTNFMDQLNIDGWKAMLFVKAADSADTCEDAPPGMEVNDPAIVRREQWIVAGDQYVFIAKKIDDEDIWYSPELGEFEVIDEGQYICCLEDLLPLIRRRLHAGEPRENMHPVLLALLEAKPS